MSDEYDDLNKKLEKEIELDRSKKAVQEKDLILKEHRVGRDLEELERNQSELEKSKSLSYGALSEEKILKLVQENDEYMEAARNAMTFLNDDFDNLVPFFKRNLILIGGDTGDGKSTTCGNVIFSVITRKNPVTDKSQRVLLLTNEEDPADYYNRITCLLMGWKYANHNKFTQEQRDTFRKYIPIWARGGRLTIMGDVHEGVPGTTTSVEGIEGVLNGLIKDYEDGKPVYDVVILDYYQNVRYSKMDPKLDEYNCQRKLAGILDQVKLRYPGPIIIMAQMKKLVDEDDSTPFNVRLKGSKLICDKATFICEIIPQRKILATKWVVHKSRFTEAVGEHQFTGYDRGKFVKYDDAFKRSVAKLVEKNLEKDKEEELPIDKSK